MEEAKTMKTPMSSSIKLDMDEKSFRFWERLLSAPRASRLVQLHLRAPKALGCVCSFLFNSLSFWTFPSPFSRWMAPRRETGTSRAQGERPAEPSQPEQTEARRKAMYDTTLFSSVEDYQRYKAKVRLEESRPREKCQFLPASTLWV
ncbi:hypothetical protein CK203_085329 [Vitis vinifera]|uniref:Uncharacterized protein n=1 Tax=Vitis vinifera TaxID=29760 RepID=A0A438DD17_VITVI|nr:hypothetical protein CK203_085329 [Vitis vinifera]